MQQDCILYSCTSPLAASSQVYVNVKSLQFFPFTSVKLNSTITTADSKYYLGICVNPMWADVSDTTSCFAVKKILTEDGYHYLCIGRSRHAQLTDQRG